MGGSPKGLLAAPDTGETLVGRALRIARELSLDVALVGEARAYADIALDVSVIADNPAGIGPLGGLRALFLTANGRPVIALACDMPFVSSTSLRALLGSQAPPAGRVAATSPMAFPGSPSSRATTLPSRSPSRPR